MRKRLRLGALSFVLAAIVVSTPTVAQDVCPFNLVHYDLDGSRFRLSDFVQVPREFPPIPGLAGPVIVVFGAHWCPPCHEVVRQLQLQRPALDAAKVHVVYVHIDDADRTDGRSREEIHALVSAMARGPEFSGVRVLLGGDLPLVQQWLPDTNLEALPGIVFINGDCQITDRMVGNPADFVDRLGAFLAAIQG